MCALTVVLCSTNQAQEPLLGRPLVQSFQKDMYQGGTQSWQIVEVEAGRMYFANNSGLLTYSGNRWKIQGLPQSTIVRSIAKGTYPTRIFAGGQDELGYFTPNQKGELQYQSLKPLIPKKYSNFEDVWDALFLPGQGAFFRASDRIYRYHKGEINVDTFATALLFLGKTQSMAWIQQEGYGIFAFKNNAWVPLPAIGLPNDIIVRQIHAWKKEEYLIVTSDHGIFHCADDKITPWKPEKLQPLKQQSIECSLLLPDGRIAIGSNFSGLYIFNPDTDQLIHYNENSGLQNPKIHAIHYDRNGNLWLGLDNGIDLVPIQQPYSVIQPSGEATGLGYTFIKSGDQFYAGTNNGLFNLQPGSFRGTMIPNTKGQVWGLNSINDQLFLGHTNGGFHVANSGAQKLNPDNNGHWTYIRHPSHKNILIAGSYYGLVIYKKINGKWKYQSTMAGFQESSRFLAAGPSGMIWVSHPYRGVFRIHLSPEGQLIESKLYNAAQGLPSDTKNYIFSLDQELVAATTQGIFRYEKEPDRFVKYDFLDSLIGSNKEILRLKQAGSKIWFITQSEVGYLEVKDLGLRKEITRHILPGLRSKMIPGFEFIYPSGPNDVYFGVENGFMHVDLSKLNQAIVFESLIEEVNLIHPHDSLIFGGIQGDSIDTPNLAASQNALRFHFGATHFGNNQKVQFRHRLKGLEDNWSNWSETTIREYTNLSAGSYEFLVESKVGQVKGGLTTYAFNILSPWYLTRAAYLSYLFIFLLALTSLVLVPRLQYKKEKEKILFEKDELSAIHKMKEEASQQTIDLLQQEKLQNEVAHKNAELASTTMHLLQKKELISQIENEFLKLKKKASDPELKQSLRKIQSMLREDTQLDQDWEHFFHHFDQVHEDFIKRLRDNHPNLTNKDHQLCAYLRMNLSTKEIAPLMNISIRGVEISRYRLRKKLNIDTQTNLSDFINSI